MARAPAMVSWDSVRDRNTAAAATNISLGS